MSGPFFYTLALVQIATRTGFDIRRHAISVLSLGDLGWIQGTNFFVTGVMAILCAFGTRRMLRGVRGGTWGPILIGLCGVGLVTGAIFHPDPGLGFPPGASADIPTTMSAAAAVHMIGFFVAFLSVIAASFVFRRRFTFDGQRGWAAY